MRNTTENGGDCGKLESRCKSPKVFKFKKIMFKYHVCVCGGENKIHVQGNFSNPWPVSIFYQFSRYFFAFQNLILAYFELNMR